MEAGKVDGFGKFLLFWTAAFLLLMLVLALSCMPPEKPENGAICMTPEMLQKTMDQCCTEGYANGYAKAKAEVVPRADIELNLITKAELVAFLKADQCDRCTSSVAGEDTSEACLDRADCLTSAARIEQWDCYGVVINFKNGSHALVAFPTEDGLLFVEPWTDQIVSVQLGRVYAPAGKVIEKIGILK